MKSNTEAKNYTISYKDGTLTVTNRADKYEITVTANSGEKTYDGQPMTVEGFKTLSFKIGSHTYTVEGLSASATGTNVSDSKAVEVNGTAKVLDADGNDVTAQFTVKTENGQLTIKPVAIELTADSDTKVYDGTALTKDSYKITNGKFVGEEGLASVTVEGSQTLVGSSDNKITGHTLKSNTEAKNYTISYQPGTLKVTAKSITDGAGMEVNDPSDYQYDGAEHKWEPTVKDGEKTLEKGTDYTVTCDKSDLTNVTGTIKVTITGTGNYEGEVIREYQITKRAVTLTSGSATKPYDGKALTNDTVTVGGDKFVEGQGATYTFTGSQTKVGSSNNTFTYALKSNTKVGNYDITVEFGTLEVTKSSSGDDDKYFFAIQKVDAQDGHALNGAKFELYQLDKNDRIKNRRVVETRQQSGKNGIALFGVNNKNSYDGIWYYAEVSAPEGYVLDRTEYEITAKDFSDSLSTAVRNADTVQNHRGTTPSLLNGDDHFAYIIGSSDALVRPNDNITRAGVATIFFRLLKDSVRDANLLTGCTYTDVPDGHWANTAISTMTGLDIVRGYDAAAFGPGDPITRAQFAAICARFDTGKSNGSRTFSDIEGHWAKAYIERAAELGWISGFQDGTFRPDAYITRAQAVTMINRMLNRIPEDESDLLPGMNVWPDCRPGDWFYLAIQEATNSHDYRRKAGSYETWTDLNANPDWTRYEN